jgi:excisionase family DNA binding protein
VSDRPLISPDEAARIIGITKQSVIEAYRKGQIKGYKMGEGLRSPLALYRDTVEAYARERQERLARKDGQGRAS